MPHDEEIPDDELQAAIHIPKPDNVPRTGVTVLGRCENPECEAYGNKIPVAADVVTRDEYGKHERTTCPKCGAVMKIYTGEHGEVFQANFDAPVDSEAE